MTEPKLDKAAFGERLKTSRIAAGLSRAELAKQAGIGKTVLERYENGERFPQGTLPQLAEVLRVDPHWLLSGREDHDLDSVVGVVAENLEETKRVISSVRELAERFTAIEARYAAIEARLGGIEAAIASEREIAEEIRAALNGDHQRKPRSTKSR
jgi:transcriptional regulator with XRE-family HTH domain